MKKAKTGKKKGKAGFQPSKAFKTALAAVANMGKQAKTTAKAAR